MAGTGGRDGEEEEARDAALIAQGLSALMGGTAALALAPLDPGMAVAGGVAVEVAVHNLAEKALGMRRAQAHRTVAYAVDVASSEGLSEAALFDALAGDPARLQLVALALDAATEAIAEVKLRMLGRALVSGALTADDASLSIEIQIVRALAELEAPHLRVLDRLYPHAEDRAGRQRALPAEDVAKNVPRWAIEGTSRRAEMLGSTSLAELANGMDGLLAVLRSHGLVEVVGPDWGEWVKKRAKSEPGSRLDPGPPEERLRITSLGCRLFERYEDAGSTGESGD